jgi:transcriptional regulator with PAS, ATPase and Fis domain
LLRSVQEHTVRPVGSTKELPVEVRLIASTNRSPEEAVRAGKLREDLYYRLQAGVIQVPPLREHPEDVPLLVEHFIDVFNERHTRATPVVGIEPDALEVLCHHFWPGNVRELANAIESAFTFGRSHTITVNDLPASVTGKPSSTPAPPLLVSFADMERASIVRALQMTEGNKLKAANLLKISRKKLYAKIAKYGLNVPAGPPAGR